jgi:DNA mismatch endonuclease (patch repair protein)
MYGLLCGRSSVRYGVYMTDIVDSGTRSRMMSGIKGKHTRPELLVRSGLHRLGFRYRLHDRKLPGKPDLILPKYGAVIFVHGCFWHRHPGCKYATTPATRRAFWQEKFEANIRRDRRDQLALQGAGWRVFVVWECALRREPGEAVERLADLLVDPECAGAEIEP